MLLYGEIDVAGAKMVEFSRIWLVSSVILLLGLTIPCSCSSLKSIIKTKSAVFLSPEFKLQPGSVSNKFYYNMDFPRGHIAVKSFDAEVVDEAGNPVPLHETYLHHWVVARYYYRKNSTEPEGSSLMQNHTDFIDVENSGLCQSKVLRQYFGLGSETRKTLTYVPDPFGIEVGNPAEIPSGYEERWLFNIHAIDTRGVEDRMGCTECRCDLYNVSKDQNGRPLSPLYKGGIYCCYDDTRCRLRNGFQGAKRGLYLKYTVKWVDWSDSIVPVKVYIYDVTDRFKASKDSIMQSAEHDCQIEYDVEKSYSPSNAIDTKRTSLSIPYGSGGYVVYAVAHLHSAGIALTLHGQDGRTICSSSPIYGKGNEVGNEAGYVVGMSTCYPQPGSVKINDGETLILESMYNSTQSHTGVMALFYILVADQLPESLFPLDSQLYLGVWQGFGSNVKEVMEDEISYHSSPTLSQRPLVLYPKHSVYTVIYSNTPIYIYIHNSTIKHSFCCGSFADYHLFWSKMQEFSRTWLPFSVILLLGLTIPCSCSSLKSIINTKSAVFLSPKFELEPGSVADKYYYNIDFPRGHIALKTFDAEVVDEAGNPVPLHETYLHHWVVARYYHLKNSSEPELDGSNYRNKRTDFVMVRNDGLCQRNVLGQYYGLGSETRRTATHVPDPFGVEVGNAAEIPSGYEEKWLLNIHAIDTRGVEDKLGCTECRCDLYNVSKDAYGRPLRPEYKGGLYCCYDDTRCRMKEGFQGAKRGLYLRYTVKWVDWSDSIVPVKIYILDVTDKVLKDSTRQSAEHHCQVEYEVKKSGSPSGSNGNTCADTKRTSLSVPSGGYVVYAVAHQHTGGIGSTLYRQDGQTICSSLPIYGDGNEVGNEAGYIVGMSTCYPQPGSIKINDGETLILESIYNSTISHTGVMGLFYILVADRLPKSLLPLHSQL
nr:uncharacterized protein LOC125423292 [Ziziphus jujuba var. spinosa]